MKIAAFLVSSSLVLSAVLVGCASAASQSDTQLAADVPSSAAATPSPQLSPDELNQLVAPIALYPDALVAQIVAGASFPTEVVEAQRWMKQHPELQGPALAQAIDQQSWDPSVKALAQFPTVLAMMDTNLSWTSSLGDAYVNEPQTVLDAVQAMRRRAQQAGNLKSTSQETITDQGQTIAIEPASPDVVYVPEYDPWTVYGTPVAFYQDWVEVPGAFYDGPGIYFGLGIGLFGGFGWGWHHWGTDWHRHDLMYDHHDYHPHSPTFDRHGHFDGHDGFDHGHAFGHADGGHAGIGHAVIEHGGLGHAGFTGAPLATHSGAFSGFNHGGITNSFSSRGQASFRAGGAGGFHAGAGGFHGGGGGFHGGGGGHR